MAIKISECNVQSGDDLELIEGEIYSLCSCGKSEKLPFCDGSHKDKAPEYRSIKVEIKRAGKVRIY
ncbi:MAG: CDGSH iron-sulfur domain-containing protein [Pseudomonadota bacterium]